MALRPINKLAECVVRSGRRIPCRYPNKVTLGAVGSAPVTTHAHTTITTAATLAAAASVAADATVATTTADATVATVVADATVVAVAAVTTCFEHATNPRGVSWSAA